MDPQDQRSSKKTERNVDTPPDPAPTVKRTTTMTLTSDQGNTLDISDQTDDEGTPRGSNEENDKDENGISRNQTHATKNGLEIPQSGLAVTAHQLLVANKAAKDIKGSKAKFVGPNGGRAAGESA